MLKPLKSVPLLTTSYFTDPDMYWEPEMKTEPGNYTDGTFSVTTPCLFDVNNIEIKWYTIVVSIE